MNTGLGSPEAMLTITRQQCQMILAQNGYDRYGRWS